MPLAYDLSLDPTLRRDWTVYDPMAGVSLPGGTPAAALFSSLAGSAAMGYGIPLGLSGQGAYDRLSSYRMQQSYDELVRKAAKIDQPMFTKMMGDQWQRAGLPWGAKQQDMMQQAGGWAADVESFIGRNMPGALDNAFGGMLAVAAATSMINAGSRRIDPVTGRIGMSNETMNTWFDQMMPMVTRNRLNAPSLTWAQVGAGALEFQNLGMLPGGRLGMQDLVAGGFSDAVTQAAMARNLDIGAGAGVDPRRRGQQLNFNQLSARELDSLRGDPGVAAALRDVDTNRINTTLKEHLKSLNAISEIFGDAGHPNAAVPELMNALNQITGGGVTQMRPERVTESVRGLYNLAKQSGLGLPGMLLFSEAANQQAMQMGLPPVFGQEALRAGLAYRAAYQQMGLGAAPIFGQESIHEQQLRAQGLNVSASRSRTANQMGALFRIAETFGGADAAFRAGSQAQAYIQAIQSGQTRYRDPRTGEMRSLIMDETEFVSMLQQGSVNPLSQESIMMRLQQRGTNLEYIFQEGLMHTVQNLQASDFLSQTAARAGSVLATTQGLDRAQSNLLGIAGISAWTNLAGDPAKFRDKQQRYAAMTGKAEDWLKAIAAGQPGQVRQEMLAAGFDQSMVDATLGQITSGDARSLLQQMRQGKMGANIADLLYGAMEEESLTGSPLGGKGTPLINVLNQFTPQAQAQREIAAAKAKARTMLQESLTPLGAETSMLQRAFQAVREAGPEANLAQIFAKTLGIANPDEIAALLAKPDGGGPGVLAQLMDKARAFEQQEKALEAEGLTPEQRAMERAKLAGIAGEYAGAAQGMVDLLRGQVDEKTLAELQQAIEEKKPELPEEVRKGMEEAAGEEGAVAAGAKQMVIRVDVMRLERAGDLGAELSGVGSLEAEGRQ